VTLAPRRFDTATEPYRRELLTHCYRMLGSIHDAEDLVQETYLRAWKGFDRFEGRSSVRTWLYRIATTACLTALETRARRPLPSGLGAPSTEPLWQPAADEEIAWLQPAPDSALGGPVNPRDPADIAVYRAGVRLAFIAALQQLPARQRAVLVLCDVLQFRPAEAADILDTSTKAIYSALLRARTKVGAGRLDPDDVTEPEDPDQQTILDRYVDAFVHLDVAGLAALLRADVELEMPPTPTWFRGREAVIAFLSAQVLRNPEQWRLLPTWGNGQPAIGVFARHSDGGYRAHGVHVLETSGGLIARVVAFNEAALVPTFGLPARLRPDDRVEGS